MALLWKRLSEMTITSKLILAKNAVAKFIDSSSVTHTMTANELATMTTSGRGTSLITTKTVTASESGKTFFLNLAGGFVTTLPAPAEGLKYKFVVGTAPTTAYTVVTDSSANIIHGSISSPEVIALVSCVAASDTISFVANLAVVGDYCEVESDGTNWYVSGMTFDQAGMTTSQVS